MAARPAYRIILVEILTTYRVTVNFADKLYTADTVRELDRRAIEDHGIPGIVLMKRAGAVAFAELLTRWPNPDRITILCGGGNNGGDGYIIAALARQRGLATTVLQLVDAEKLQGDARRAWQFACQEGVPMRPFKGALDSAGGPIVDALLGTGIKGDVRASYKQAIAAINASGSPVLAVDIPSGLCSDTGAVRGAAVIADVTVTFIGVKSGLLTGRGPALVGDLVYRDLDVPPQVFDDVPVAAQRLDLLSLMADLPQRERDAHKGKFGHVLVIGGDQGFGGAAAMAAEAAIRVGAGLVGVATRASHVPALLARRPELMVKAVESGQQLEPLLEAPTVLVVGPGLGRSTWSEQVLQQAIKSGIPMVVDADALNLLSEGVIGAGADSSAWVLTPHPGEAARLLNISNADVQRDRLAACRSIQQAYAGTVLLKGAGTLICSGDETLSLCLYGNPGMATGGMGDVLAGIIGGLLAQGLSGSKATELGACLHGAAADLVAEEFGERGMMATDLLAPLQRLVNGK
ncbi:MAG: bifunctional ADP-dependent NAD(P)H-hydrate dehydratase/NAD(P)H-hydrate epimerase [Gammaproteobacteria bacterium]|nr:MAG: bifunctional ADP-dependent NAD(P)H-hydrate dehydratase/NAD(P)H-hydrate epimerase [Gammaproteobacteria bacterium]